MNLSRFNVEGIEAFRKFLDSLRTNPLLTPPFELLTDSSYSNEIARVEVHSINFKTRLAAGEWLLTTLDHPDISGLAKDIGLWSWLSLLHFNSVCPADPKGERHPGHLARHIPEVTNFQRYYRHLLLGPWSIVRAYRDAPETALCVLCQPLDSPGDIVEQLASRVERITNRALISAATKLYVDPITHLPRRGSGGKSQGGPRRLTTVCDQYDVTYDLYTINADELIGMLPKEFNRFRPK